MTARQVKFYKNLLSSDGHPFKVLQRVISVDRSKDADDAVRIAQHRFERLEQIGDWTLHADYVETDAGKPRSDRSSKT